MEGYSSEPDQIPTDEFWFLRITWADIRLRIKSEATFSTKYN
jgi:hypothetical protein